MAFRHTLHSRIHTHRRWAQAEESDFPKIKTDDPITLWVNFPGKSRFYPTFLCIDHTYTNIHLSNPFIQFCIHTVS